MPRGRIVPRRAEPGGQQQAAGAVRPGHAQVRGRRSNDHAGSLARDLPETALHVTSRRHTTQPSTTPLTCSVAWVSEVMHGVVNHPSINGMQGVRGSNPLSSTPGQRPCSASIAPESPASGSKSAAICLEGRSSVRHGGPAGQHRWRRRPVDPGRAGGPVRDLAAPPGTEGHGPGPADGWDAPIGMAPGGSCGAVAPTTISKDAVSRLPAAGVRRQPCRSGQSSRPSA